MESETAQELMEIQSALQDKLAIKSEINCDEPGKTGDRCNTFKRPKTCSKCGKAFTSKSKLDIHERIHTDEKPFSCSKCNYKCKQSSSLKTHGRIHTGERPFSCTKCDKKFTQKCHLKTHDRTHTNEKPWSKEEIKLCLKFTLTNTFRFQIGNFLPILVARCHC